MIFQSLHHDTKFLEISLITLAPLGITLLLTSDVVDHVVILKHDYDRGKDGCGKLAQNAALHDQGVDVADEGNKACLRRTC
jgi:hypothetical protein